MCRQYAPLFDDFSIAGHLKNGHLLSVEMIGASNIVLMFYLNQLVVHWVALLADLKVSGMSDSVHLIKCMRQVLCLFVIMPWKYGA